MGNSESDTRPKHMLLNGIPSNGVPIASLPPVHNPVYNNAPLPSISAPFTSHIPSFSYPQTQFVGTNGGYTNTMYPMYNQYGQQVNPYGQNYTGNFTPQINPYGPPLLPMNSYGQTNVLPNQMNLNQQNSYNVNLQNNLNEVQDSYEPGASVVVLKTVHGTDNVNHVDKITNVASSPIVIKAEDPIEIKASDDSIVIKASDDHVVIKASDDPGLIKASDDPVVIKASEVLESSLEEIKNDAVEIVPAKEELLGSKLVDNENPLKQISSFENESIIARKSVVAKDNSISKSPTAVASTYVDTPGMNVKILEDMLSCEICFDNFDLLLRRPKSLHCGHTICDICIGKLLSNSKLDPPQSNCPSCHVEFCETDLKTNFAVESIMHQMNEVKCIQIKNKATKISDVVAGPKHTKSNSSLVAAPLPKPAPLFSNPTNILTATKD